MKKMFLFVLNWISSRYDDRNTETDTLNQNKFEFFKTLNRAMHEKLK